MKFKLIISTLLIFLLTFSLSNLYASNAYNEIQKDTSKKETDIKVIEHVIERYAEDSIIQDIKNKKIYLYGKAYIKYGDIKIEANEILIDWSLNNIYAKSSIDSIGNTIGKPVFSEKEESFEAMKITYNFQSKKCIIEEIITQDGEGYIHGLKVKKQKENIFFIKKGESTTCNAKNPHYSIKSKKVKFTPNHEIVTGPAYLTFFNIPTPIILPFGYFPHTQKKTSGIILPQYGESANLGFFLKDGGYYFNINDYLDLSIKADIYTKGSWGAKSSLRYKKRYKYNGNINVNFGNIINSEKGFQDYSVKKDFFVRWNHNQDPKLNPTINFSANVNAGTSTYHQNNNFTNINDYLSNTFQSNINITKRWKSLPFTLSTNLGHNQNTQTHKVNILMPQISFNMNRSFPFKNFGESGKKYWFHKIGVGYSMNTKNELSFIDSMITRINMKESLRNGMKHTIPISTSLNILKHFTLSPKINITERWYLRRINKTWDGYNIITDTINQFTRGGDYNISSSLNTKIYGVKYFKKGRVSAFRHVINPNISFSYNPSFNNKKYGLYENVQSDTLGNTETYSIMQNGIYGSPRQNESGSIGININNLLDMKIRKVNDTNEVIKKIKLIENISFNTSYNIFADSLKIGLINLNLRTKIFNMININYRSSFDPYVNSESNRINKLEILENQKIARFINSNTSIGINISNKSFYNKEDKQEDASKNPWNINTNYTYSINKNSTLSTNKTHNINLSGNMRLTNKWRIGFNSGYDFINNDFSYTSIDIYRDLHCWEMLFNWIPIGYRRSYSLTIQVKAPILKDLKIERKKDWLSPNFN